MAALIHKAMALNDNGVVVARAPREKKTAGPRAGGPGRRAAEEQEGKAAFDAFSPSHKREYVEWITEAKRDETRSEASQTAIKWIAEGKSRNWKYE